MIRSSPERASSTGLRRSRIDSGIATITASSLSAVTGRLGEVLEQRLERALERLGVEMLVVLEVEDVIGVRGAQHRAGRARPVLRAHARSLLGCHFVGHRAEVRAQWVRRVCP